MLNLSLFLFLVYMVGYPIRLFFTKYERVVKQLNFKDENLNDLVVNKTQMLEKFKIEILFPPTTWDDLRI